MLRQISSRNQRSGGFKLHHALQICVLVAICIWFLYQAKHSHDKKKALEKTNLRFINKIDESQPEIFRINRKDLPQTVGMDIVNETQNEDEENEVAEEARQEAGQEEMEDGEGRGDGNELINEQDHESADEEAERGAFAYAEEKDGQAEELDLAENEEHDVRTQAAREESFKGDDASSAVFEGIQNREHESDCESCSLFKEKVENIEGKELEIDGKSETFDEKLERKELEMENMNNATNKILDGSKGNDSSVQNVVDDSDGNESSVTLGTNKTIQSSNIPVTGSGVEKRELQGRPLSNATLGEHNDQLERQNSMRTTTASDDQTELLTNSTTTKVSEDQTKAWNSMMVEMVMNGGHLQNESVGLDSAPDQNGTVEMEIHREDTSKSDNEVVEQSEHPDTITTSPEESSRSSAVTLAANGNGDIAQGEGGDTSHNLSTEEEKEAHAVLSILPGNQIEV